MQLWASGQILHSFMVCVWVEGVERGGHCPLMNLRFVFLPGGRAGTGFLPRTPFLNYFAKQGLGLCPVASSGLGSLAGGSHCFMTLHSDISLL